MLSDENIRILTRTFIWKHAPLQKGLNVLDPIIFQWYLQNPSGFASSPWLAKFHSSHLSSMDTAIVTYEATCHWTLVVLYPIPKDFHYYCSLGSKIGKDRYLALQNFSSTIFPPYISSDWGVIYPREVQQQQVGTMDCGICVFLNLANVLYKLRASAYDHTGQRAKFKQDVLDFFRCEQV
jgi:hypothetical protein